MCAILSVDSTAQQSMLELLLPHVAAFLPAQEGELPPLKLDQCAKLQVSSHACLSIASRADCPSDLVAQLVSSTECSQGWNATVGGSQITASVAHVPAHQPCIGKTLRVFNCVQVQAGELVVNEPLHLLLDAVRRMLPAQPDGSAADEHAPVLTDVDAADAPDKVGLPVMLLRAADAV